MYLSPQDMFLLQVHGRAMHLQQEHSHSKLRQHFAWAPEASSEGSPRERCIWLLANWLR